MIIRAATTGDTVAAFDGWGSAVLGGSIGGTATGLALALTIWHDRSARRQDRAHAAAETCHRASSCLMTELSSNETTEARLLAAAADLEIAAVLFRGRLRRRNTATGAAMVTLARGVLNRVAEPGLPDSEARLKMLAEVRTCTKLVADWTTRPKTARADAGQWPAIVEATLDELKQMNAVTLAAQPPKAQRWPWSWLHRDT